MPSRRPPDSGGRLSGSTSARPPRTTSSPTRGSSSAVRARRAARSRTRRYRARPRGCHRWSSTPRARSSGRTRSSPSSQPSSTERRPRPTAWAVGSARSSRAARRSSARAAATPPRGAPARPRARGADPFALTFDLTAHAAELRERHSDLPPDTVTDDHVSVAGRVVLRRSFGKLVFLVLRDGTGDIQLFCSAVFLDDDDLALLEEIDLGDLVGAAGPVMTTRKGELSIRAHRLA